MKIIKYIFVMACLSLALFASESPNCLTFTDYDDYVHIEDDPLRFTTRFTLECWFNINEFEDSTALIDFSTYNLHEDYVFGYGIYVMDSSRIAVRLGNFTRTFEMIIDSLKTDIWYHFAVTYDKFKNDENIVAFLNGHIVKKEDCDIYLQYPETFRPYGLMLGAYYDFPFLRAFKGQLDDVRFWTDVRTNEEILYNMDRPLDPESQGLIGYYTFDQVADSILIDLSDSKNHGSLENLTDSSWQLSYAHLAVEQPTDVSFDRIVLPWTSSHEFNSYCIDLSEDESFSSSLDGFPVYDISTNYFILDSIDPGTYYYRVKGHYDGQEIDQEPWTDVQVAATMTDASTDIKLSNFGSEQENDGILIYWETASQTENASFILERKSDNGKWGQIHQTAGAGTSSEKMYYSYLDKDIIPGKKYYYRLKDISYSGEINISENIEIMYTEIDIAENESFILNSVYPNPFNPSTNISFDINKETDVTMNIYSLQGEKIAGISNKHYATGSYSISWAPINLSSGIYLLDIVSNNQRINHKLLYLK